VPLPLCLVAVALYISYSLPIWFVFTAKHSQKFISTFCHGKDGPRRQIRAFPYRLSNSLPEIKKPYKGITQQK
jgi:hypothetical protein